jgi:hypothetical protein
MGHHMALLLQRVALGAELAGRRAAEEAAAVGAEGGRLLLGTRVFRQLEWCEPGHDGFIERHGIKLLLPLVAPRAEVVTLPKKPQLFVHRAALLIILYGRAREIGIAAGVSSQISLVG